MEVELYRQEGLLGEENEVPVVGFETSPEVFGLLKTSEPQFKRLFFDDVISTLANADAKHSRDLRELFPFDVINLDLTVNLVAPSEGPYGPVPQAIRECFKLQGAQMDDWSLMLTFRAIPSETSGATIDFLTSQFQENIDDIPQIKDACFQRYNRTKAQEILDASPEEALGQFTAKWIVDQAHSFDFKVIKSEHVSYERAYSSGSYTICTLAFIFKKERLPKYAMPGKRVPMVGWHVEDLVNVVKGARQNIDRKIEALKSSSPDYILNLQGEIEHLKGLGDSDSSTTEYGDNSM